MEDRNICHFMPCGRDYGAIHVINFVLETKGQKFEGMRSHSVYRMHYVAGGSGILHMPGRCWPLGEGVLFFVLPAVPFAIEDTGGLEHIYISYIGPRANMIMDRLRISGQNCVFSDFGEVGDFWRDSLRAGAAMRELRSESVLLYTFSVLGGRILEEERAQRRKTDSAERIKRYVDDNFSDMELSLEKIGEALGYHRKYVSGVFKERLHIGVAEYLNVVRIQHACTLMEQGFTSVQDIASLCGFRDPLYFSRVFRERMGISPRGHLKTLCRDSEGTQFRVQK